MANETGPFNPYHKLLGIPKEATPPDHYTLLGLTLFETDPEAISNAADARMMFLRSFQTGKYAEVVQKVLNEVSAARVCLLNETDRLAYDVTLRARLPKTPVLVTPVAMGMPVTPVVSVVPPPPGGKTPPVVTPVMGGNLLNTPKPPLSKPPLPKPPVLNPVGISLFETESEAASSTKLATTTKSTGKASGKTSGTLHGYGRRKKRWKALALVLGAALGVIVMFFCFGGIDKVSETLRNFVHHKAASSETPAVGETSAESQPNPQETPQPKPETPQPQPETPQPQSQAQQPPQPQSPSAEPPVPGKKAAGKNRIFQNCFKR